MEYSEGTFVAWNLEYLEGTAKEMEVVMYD
jgi:hypothetical protein